MSTTTPSPATAYSAAPPRPPHPTPSPFSFSVTSTRWSAQPPIQTANLVLRFLALVLSATSAISLAAVSPMGSKHTNFWDHPEFVYCFSVNILEFIYAAYQLFKGICDIAHRGIFVSDNLSDYISFILDQLTGNLLVSASSVAVPAIQEMSNGNPLKKAATISVCISFALFLVIEATALISGYTLCKRIIW